MRLPGPHRPEASVSDGGLDLKLSCATPVAALFDNSFYNREGGLVKGAISSRIGAGRRGARRVSFILTGLLAIAVVEPVAAPAQSLNAENVSKPEQRAAATEAQMTADERIKLVSGILALPFGNSGPIP